MADILGLVASVLQLVDMVVQARDYIKDFRDAPKDQLALLLEIQGLERVVGQLDKRVKGNLAETLASGMRELEEPLIQLKRTMEKLTRKLDISEASCRLVWPLWGKKEVQEGLDTIERFKSLLTIWMGMKIS